MKARRRTFEKLNATGRLPSPSGVAFEVLRLCRSQHCSLHDIAKAVEGDPSLTGELLKYANSARGYTGEPITALPQATVRLGLEVVRNLVLGFSLLSGNRSGRSEQFDYERFWSHSLGTACAARELAARVDGLRADDAFVYGLLSQIGRLALASVFPVDYSEIVAEPLPAAALLEREQARFGMDHDALTGEMLAHWGLPPDECRAVVAHGSPGGPAEGAEVAGLEEALRLASLVASMALTGGGAEVATAERLAARMGVAPDELGGVFDEAVAAWRASGELYRVSADGLPDYDGLREHEQLVQAWQPGELVPLSILLVDDDPHMARALAGLLDGKGDLMITARDGEQALRLALDQGPDLLIANWDLPGMTGVELCKAMRSAPATASTHIIMLTPSASSEGAAGAFAAGADDFLSKPFTPKALEARLRSARRQVLHRRKAEQEREVVRGHAAELSAANRRLETIAMTDSLTELPNRRGALRHLRQAWVGRRGSPGLACILVDIDHFKRINETLGHDVGDEVLRETATTLARTVRSSDCVSRFGGEEFLVVCEHTDRHGAVELAERLRTSVQGITPIGRPSPAVLTVSLGVACQGDDRGNYRDLIRRADAALDTAKRNGRNRTAIAS